MSKKVNAKANATTPATLKEYFELYPNVSIRRLAQATNITYGLMLKKSKEPIPGEAYNPEAINWTALEQYLIKREVNIAELDWDALNVETVRQGATLIKDMNQFTVGSKVYLRKNNTTPYEIIYKTATHIVLMLEGTSEPTALSNNTFLLYGPAFEPRATVKEFEE